MKNKKLNMIECKFKQASTAVVTQQEKQEKQMVTMKDVAIAEANIFKHYFMSGKKFDFS